MVSDKASIAKFGPAIFFRVLVSVPERIEEEERVRYAEDFAMQFVKTHPDYRKLDLPFGEAYAHKTTMRFGTYDYEVAVIFRWG